MQKQLRDHMGIQENQINNLTEQATNTISERLFFLGEQHQQILQSYNQISQQIYGTHG